MLQEPSRRSTRYHIFMLSLWEAGGSAPGEPATWRCSLEHGSTGERRGFKSVAELITYLEGWTLGAPGDTSATRSEEADTG